MPGRESSAASEREWALYNAASAYRREVVPLDSEEDEVAAADGLDAALNAYDAWCPRHGGFDPDQRGPGWCPYCVADGSYA